MTYLTRFCSGCHEERLFEPFHADPGTCPDEADGGCREWGCAVCGEALIVGLPAQAALAGAGAFQAA